MSFLVTLRLSLSLDGSIRVDLHLFDLNPDPETLSQPTVETPRKGRTHQTCSSDPDGGPDALESWGVGSLRRGETDVRTRMSDPSPPTESTYYSKVLFR